MWCSKYLLEFRHVTHPFLAEEFAFAVVAWCRVRGELCHEAVLAVCYSSVLGWTGIEGKYLKFVNTPEFQERLFNTQFPLRFHFQPYLERLSYSLWVLCFWF